MLFSVFWESSAEIPGGLPPQHNVLNPQELLPITPSHLRAIAVN